jgi:DNA-binding Xre family transcriptional regulator
MNIQIIEKNGKPEWAILPYSTYLELLADHDDNKKISAFKEKLSAGQEELIPKDFVNRIIDGESPIKVYRKFRKLSLSDLAAKANISVPYLSQLEHNERKGGADSLKRIAIALGITIDDII